MGQVALRSRILGQAGLRTGQETGGQCEAARASHRACSWKRLGRPAFLPAPVPLGLLAG